MNKGKTSGNKSTKKNDTKTTKPHVGRPPKSDKKSEK